MPRTLSELASGLEGLIAQYGSGSSSGTAPGSIPGGSIPGGSRAAVAAATLAPVAEAAQPAPTAPAAQQLWQPVGSALALQSQPSDLQLLLQVLAASQQGSPEAAPQPEPAAALARPQALLTPQPQLRGPAPAQLPAATTPMAPLRGMLLEEPQQREPVDPGAALAAGSLVHPPLAAVQQHLEALDNEGELDCKGGQGMVNCGRVQCRWDAVLPPRASEAGSVVWEGLGGPKRFTSPHRQAASSCCSGPRHGLAAAAAEPSGAAPFQPLPPDTAAAHLGQVRACGIAWCGRHAAAGSCSLNALG